MRKKRGQNQGSVYQRGSDQRWVAQVTLHKKHVMKYFTSQPDAETWLSQALLHISQGMPVAGSRVTLAAFLASWLEVMSSSLRLKTWIQYQQVVKKHVLPGLGNLSVQDLGPDQIQAFYRLKQRNGASDRTLSIINCILHHALEHAVTMGIILHNPANKVIKPRYHYHEREVLDADQVKGLLLACKGTRWEALFCLAVTSGMREGELLGLKWMDIHWDRGQLQIQRQLQRIPGQGLVFSEPKTASSRRNLALGKEMVAKLRAHADLQERERCLAGKTWQEHNLVFPTLRGAPIDPSWLYHFYKRLLKQAGLPDISFHDLRHTAATLMLGWGIHPKVAQERLGHAHISYTLGTYSHVLPPLQLEAAEKMDGLIQSVLKREQASEASMGDAG
jgi:integrase